MPNDEKRGGNRGGERTMQSEMKGRNIDWTRSVALLALAFLLGPLILSVEAQLAPPFLPGNQ
jgi:hypothetical protein